MTTKDENLIVKLVKKSVGLPTGKSGCCAPASPTPKPCCGTETPEQASRDCDCASTASADQKPPEQS
ncbi:MAG: hypothetical protein ACM3QS_17960 [Bacteroidota bacterium]